MTYADKLKGFIGKEGVLCRPDQEYPYFWLAIKEGGRNSDADGQIEEVGDDYVVISEKRSFRKLVVPHTIFFVYLD
jgi:hypothetical protein